MKVLHERIALETRRPREVVDVTGRVEEWLREIRARSGLLLVYSPHTTMSIVVNESEPGLKEDIISLMSEITKPGAPWRHNLVDENAHAHLSNIVLGGERVIPVINGRLALGTWQRIMVVEMDGPRSRQITLVFIGETES